MYISVSSSSPGRTLRVNTVKGYPKDVLEFKIKTDMKEFKKDTIQVNNHEKIFISCTNPSQDFMPWGNSLLSVRYVITESSVKNSAAILFLYCINL